MVAYVVQPVTRSWWPSKRKRVGFFILRIERIGQRYVPVFKDLCPGVWKPEYVYGVRDEGWSKSIGGAKRVISKLKKKDAAQFATINFRHPTFTGSIGGPGFFPLSHDGVPLLAQVTAAGETEPPLGELLPEVRRAYT